jgi:tRNA guanosine-2'-O-methyltransferase
MLFYSILCYATGGLARTCEIFAVEKLVLADLSVTKGEVFQGIAVSSDSWLPMEEVPVPQLPSYLRHCKMRGYTIIALEQTDSSEAMQNCRLPSKCVLLLGREREGIPVELLHEVDLCIEIPQFGVTRSLNVHVSASLALWEITAQNEQFVNSVGKSD